MGLGTGSLVEGLASCRTLAPFVGTLVFLTVAVLLLRVLKNMPSILNRPFELNLWQWIHNQVWVRVAWALSPAHSCPISALPRRGSCGVGYLGQSLCFRKAFGDVSLIMLVGSCALVYKRWVLQDVEWRSWESAEPQSVEQLFLCLAAKALPWLSVHLGPFPSFSTKLTLAHDFERVSLYLLQGEHDLPN